eukprot:TRINITY_DN1638_c0_g1_i1.p7 TRINITY_DN1638_c0_g1~~TRINITY_DN1638_c0_g1_i1.p7  ORF type:complete len:223 (-),score=19.41 TRINITY_DN1638_c0_g1_i1:109-777(-)
MFKQYLFYYYVKSHYENKEFFEKYSGLLTEYSHKGLARFTPLANIVRNALIIPLSILLEAFPMMLALSFLLINGLVFAWFATLTPGKTKPKNVFVCLREISILAINVLYILLTQQETMNELIGALIVSSMWTAYACEFLGSLIDSIIATLKWLYERKIAAESKKCYPADIETDLNSVKPLSPSKRKRLSEIPLKEITEVVVNAEGAQSGRRLVIVEPKATKI